MHKVYLSKRNINSLLSKLDRNKITPGSSACTIIKGDNKHRIYPQTARTIVVIATESESSFREHSIDLLYLYLDRNYLEKLSKSLATVLLPVHVIPNGLSNEIEICAIQDEEYYTDRHPGEVYPADLPQNN